MATVKWHEGPMIAFDTETTGIDPHNERIVTAAVVIHRPGHRPNTTQWVINPGRDIPTEAADVHGWTLDRITATLGNRPAGRLLSDGTYKLLPRDAALYEISTKVGFAIGQKLPIVGANLAYDLTLLEAELARNDVDTLASRPAGITGVIDVQVIEKAFDPYRKVKGGCRGGKVKCGGCGVEDKKLSSLAAHYGVHLGDAHDAGADALATIRLAKKLAEAWPDIARLKLETLHQKQVEWRRDQMLSLRSYFDKAGIEHDGCCPEWPVHARCAPAAEAVA